jgi:hypothetical protein
MTVALCIRCGAMKHGALTPCNDCGFDPDENEDKAKAMVLTDHFLPREELEAIAGRIKSGQPVIYPEEAVKEFIRTFEENPDILKPGYFNIGCSVAIVVIIAALVWIIVS